MRYFVAFFLMMLVPGSAQAQAARILLDGAFDDWAALDPVHTDPSGDALSGMVDFERLWVANDERYLFLRFELNAETLIQEGNQVILYIDTDDDPTTGRPIHGLGADFWWVFGQRNGFFFVAPATVLDIGHSPVGIVTAPTISSTVFEIAFERDAMPGDVQPLFPGATIRLALEDDASGDLLPDDPGGVAYTFDDATTLPVLVPATLRKEGAGDLRLLSYNVQRDALFDPARGPAFARLLQAAAPDVIGFQEILGHSAEETAAVVAAAVPLPSGQTWHAARVNPDLVLVSRYPIRSSFVIEGANQGRANAAFLLDLQAEWGADLLLIDAHPPCCRADVARQVEFDAMMAFIREAKATGGLLDLDPLTPIVLLGDMNLVGFAQQLNTLLAGQIVNTGLFGPSFDPDWDDTPLADLSPRHVALPMTFTWYNESSSFHPGRLDFMVYTDSVLEPGNNFVLFTPAMPADSLAAYGLEPDDATFASDHLPVVGDFRYDPSMITGVDDPDSGVPDGFALAQNYPNPFNPSTRIAYTLPAGGRARLAVYDVMGREVAVLFEGTKTAGRHEAVWNAGGWPSGTYFYRLEASGRILNRVMILLR